jgi:hypothetical protein
MWEEEAEAKFKHFEKLKARGAALKKEGRHG